MPGKKKDVNKNYHPNWGGRRKKLPTTPDRYQVSRNDDLKLRRISGCDDPEVGFRIVMKDFEHF